MPWVAAVATIVAAGVSTYAAVKQGQAAEEAGKRAQKAENENAKAAQDAAALEAGQIRRRNLIRMGTQRANAAKSGVLIDDSAADVIYDTAIQGELEALSTVYSGATAAGYYGSRGRNARLAGGAAKSAANINAGASLIGGLGSAANQYDRGRQPDFG